MSRYEEKDPVLEVVALANRAIEATKDAAVAQSQADSWRHKFMRLQDDMRDFADALPAEFRERFIALVDDR